MTALAALIKYNSTVGEQLQLHFSSDMSHKLTKCRRAWGNDHE